MPFFIEKKTLYNKTLMDEREVLRQISLPCVSTPADTFLVLRTLLNCLDCIIFWNCYKRNHSLMFFESSKFCISIANMRLSFVFTIENLYLIKNEILR